MSSMPDIVLSYAGLRLLNVFLAEVQLELCGADLIRLTKLPSGTVYPILIRFDKEYRLLSSRWENGDPIELGRPRKRLYKITPLGRRLAQEKLKQLTLAPQWI